MKRLRLKASAGGAVLMTVAILLWIYGKLRPGPDYSQVVVGGSLFVCGTLCVVLGEVANLLGGLAKALRSESEEAGESSS
ncbi:MAG: hypothetical protein GW892_18060 [Armatimonadetes bacterium]|nr:hypothetical protein [Armatimonadota bacterium]